MGGVEPAENPSPVQEIVEQGIDRDQPERRPRTTSGDRSIPPIRIPDNAIVRTLSDAP